MVMLLSSQLCFAVFLARLSFTQAERNSSRVSSNDNKTRTYERGVDKNTGCSWNCTIIGSDFPEQWKAVSIKHRLIEVVVEYEKKVTEQCAKQASRNSSGNATEYFNVWLPPNNKPSNFDHAVQRVLDLFFSPNTEERVKVKAACAFRPLRTRSPEPAISTLNSDIPDILSQSIRSHLAVHGFNAKSKSKECSAEEMTNFQLCVTMRNSTVNSTVDSHLMINRRVLLVGFSALAAIVLTAFMYYSPAYICLFSPTVITEHGLRQIVLEGASPVSFRSLTGNYFHSGCDTRHWARMLFLRLVLFPLPFLPSAIVFHQLPPQSKNVLSTVFSQPFMTIFLVCYVLQAIFSSFFKVSHKVKPCIVCRFVKPNLACKDESRRRVLNHLRIQPLILIKCWYCFCECLVYYFKLSRVILPARKNMSPRWFFCVAGFLVFLSTIPAVTITLFAAMLVVDVFSLIFTSPLSVLLEDDMGNSGDGSSLVRLPVLKLVRIFIRVTAFSGALLFVGNSAGGVVIIIAVVFILLLSEQSLPFVVLFGLVCYYLWSSYSSFTNKYHDLSLILFKCYQEHRHDQISNEAVTASTADPAQEVERTPNPENKDSVIKIPKELFDTACEELIPIRESVCVLVLKVVLILSFVFLVFGLVMVFHVGVTPMMRALVTFLTGSLPRIVAIYIDGARKRKLESMVIEERAPRIVQRYVKGSSSIDQENDSFGTNSGEVVFVDENEEVIQLVNMKK